MALYIKANALVAQFLNLQNDRLRLEDGNYILWQADMLSFGSLTRLDRTLADIGGIALRPHEARQEQDGTVLRPLPVATDPRFIEYAPEDDEDEPAEESTEEETTLNDTDQDV